MRSRDWEGLGGRGSPADSPAPRPRLSPRLRQVPVDGGSQGASRLLLQDPLLSCVPHCYAQEVSRLCHLSAGTYRIVPSTYLPDTEGAFTVTIATRIDRWGSGAGGGPRCLSIHLPVLSRLPCLPQRLSVPAEQQRAGREPWDPSLPGSLAGSVAALALGARRPTVSCLPQALHSQPGKAGAASPGGTCGA